MKTIHKFRLESGKALNTLKLKPGYRVVRCEYLVSEKAVFLWVEQSLKVDLPEVERQFLVACAGEPAPSSYDYVDTALAPFGPEACGVFEVNQQPQRENGHSSDAQQRALLSTPPLQSAGAA